MNAGGRGRRGFALHAALTLAVALLCFVPRLGDDGLVDTEGLRAVPGWRMSETGDWGAQEIYGAEYRRKPPGMAWAIALSSGLLGETELAARAPSALAGTALALAALCFGRRWMGAPWGLLMGLSVALLPRLWPFARRAEIEALALLGTTLAAYAIIDCAARRGRGGVWMALIAAAGGALMTLVKGPAGAPVIFAAAVGAAACGGRPRDILARLAAALAGGAAGVGIAIAAHDPLGGGAPIVDVENIPHFLWRADELLRAATLPVAAWAGCLPLSLFMLTMWGADARAEAGALPSLRRARRVAMAGALAFAVSVCFFALMGIGNPRYALPAIGLVAPSVGYAAMALARAPVRPLRRRIVRGFSLGSPLALGAALLLGAMAWAFVAEPRHGATSGRADALRIGAGLEPGAVVYGEGIVEARPEVLEYVQRAGDGVEARWRQMFVDEGEADLSFREVITPSWRRGRSTPLPAHAWERGGIDPGRPVYACLLAEELEAWRERGVGAPFEEFAQGESDGERYWLVRVRAPQQGGETPPR